MGSCVHTVIQVLVVAGGIQVGRKVRDIVKEAQKQQKALCAEVAGRTNMRKPQKVAVNKQFFHRLLHILSMYVETRMAFVVTCPCPVHGGLCLPCQLVHSRMPDLGHCT